MKKLNKKNLDKFLNQIIKNKIQSSLMIWGAPGIGKSSIVESVANSNDLELIDLRISQLAPTDLRGIPVPKDDKAFWFPPEFLPTEGKGILFLDEINAAPPSLTESMLMPLLLSSSSNSKLNSSKTGSNDL